MFKTKVLPSIVVVLIALGIFIGYKIYLNSQTEEGNKEITVKMVIDDETKTTVTFKTDQQTLGKALDEQELIQTKTESFGRYVIGVNGQLADTSDDSWFTKLLKTLNIKKSETVATDKEYWAIYINGEYGMLGIDDQPIHDGDVITFELEKIDDAQVQ